MTDTTPNPAAEPPNHTMLMGIDNTPGYEGQFVGVWHRRDEGAWVTDEEHHWFSSYCQRTPCEPYTWAEALERGARPDMVLAAAEPDLDAVDDQDVPSPWTDDDLSAAYAEAGGEVDADEGPLPDPHIVGLRGVLNLERSRRTAELRQLRGTWGRYWRGEARAAYRERDAARAELDRLRSDLAEARRGIDTYVEALAAERAANQTQPQDAARPDLREVLEDALARHYEAWPDTAVTSPHEAAAYVVESVLHDHGLRNRSELDKAIRQRDSLARRCAVRFQEAEQERDRAERAEAERDAARGKLAPLRHELEIANRVTANTKKHYAHRIDTLTARAERAEDEANRYARALSEEEDAHQATRIDRDQARQKLDALSHVATLAGARELERDRVRKQRDQALALAADLHNEVAAVMRVWTVPKLRQYAASLGELFTTAIDESSKENS